MRDRDQQLVFDIAVDLETVIRGEERMNGGHRIIAWASRTWMLAIAIYALYLELSNEIQAHSGAGRN